MSDPRLSVRREDAERCEAVLIPLVLEGTVLHEDRARAPLLVPLGLSCAVLGTYGAIMSPDPNAGGPEAAAAAATRAWAEQAGL